MGFYTLDFFLGSCQYVDMVCIFCGFKTQVVNSRSQKKLKQVWRRRKCPNCNNVFSTIEHINFSNSLLIINTSGEIEKFLKEKLFISIFDSLKHRTNSIEDAIAITDTIMSNLLVSLQNPVISREVLINTSSGVLSKFDKAAAVHYRAYYPVN